MFDAERGRIIFPKTGRSLSSLQNKAKKFLNKLDKQNLIRSIEESVAKHSISPRYIKLVFIALNNADKAFDETNPFDQIIVESN